MRRQSSRNVNEETGWKRTIIRQALRRVSPPKGEFMWIDLSSFPHRRAGLAKTRGENIQADTSGRHFLSLSGIMFLALAGSEVSSLSAIQRGDRSLKGSLWSAGRKIRFLKLR